MESPADSQALPRCTRNCSLLAGRRRSPPQLHTRQTIPVLAHVPPETSPRPSSKEPVETQAHAHRFLKPHRGRPVQSRVGSRTRHRTPIPCHSMPIGTPGRPDTWQSSRHKTGNTSVRGETDTASAFGTTTIRHIRTFRCTDCTLAPAHTPLSLHIAQACRMMYSDIRSKRSGQRRGKGDGTKQTPVRNESSIRWSPSCRRHSLLLIGSRGAAAKCKAWRIPSICSVRDVALAQTTHFHSINRIPRLTLPC